MKLLQVSLFSVLESGNKSYVCKLLHTQTKNGIPVANQREPWVLKSEKTLGLTLGPNPGTTLGRGWEVGWEGSKEIEGAMVSFQSFDDNWHTKRPTISERIKFTFNNELLSDVKFVVPASRNENESQKSRKCMIPAHKFVLAISSPVFYAMFYGEMTETADTIQLPDCDCESLLELFRFVYSDEVNLSVSNVMQVLYLAKKIPGTFTRR